MTIDDHEVANLKSLMDEIWGEENFVAIVAWQKAFAKKNKALISGSHDHILVYARSVAHWSRNLLPREDEQLAAFRNPDNDSRGPWQSVAFSVQSEDAERRRDYRYEISLPSGRKVGPPTGRHWNGLEPRYEALRDDNRLWFGSDGNRRPRQKAFLSEVQAGIVPDTWWRHEFAGNNQDAKKEILELFGDSEPYSTPKPTKLINRIIQIATTKDSNDIVLDFFAGSGTTAHSVIASNRKDAGSRRFILIQLPEPTGRDDYPTIADITKERIRRAIKEQKTAGAGQLTVDDDSDLGFRVFKLDRSNIREWGPNPEDLEAALFEGVDHLHEGRTELDVLYELLLKLGLDLCVPIEERIIADKPVHSVGAGTLLVCLAKGIATDEAEQLALGIAAWREEQNPAGETTVIFRDSAFADDVAKTNIAAILEQHGLQNVRSL